MGRYPTLHCRDDDYPRRQVQLDTRFPIQRDCHHIHSDSTNNLQHLSRLPQPLPYVTLGSLKLGNRYDCNHLESCATHLLRNRPKPELGEDVAHQRLVSSYVGLLLILHLQSMASQEKNSLRDCNDRVEEQKPPQNRTLKTRKITISRLSNKLSLLFF